MATLSIVIPAYNEEARLPSLLDVVIAQGDDAASAAGLELLEVLIVDDGSTDRTVEILEAGAAGDERITPVVEFDRNRGKGAAFAAGVARARGDFVLLADVDLSTPLAELGKLFGAIEAGADIAIGSRAAEGAVVERGPAYRKLMGKTFNASVRLLTGLRIQDTQNGFKLFPTAIAKELLTQQTCPGFAFDVELLMRADRAGLAIAEVPIFYLHDPRSSVSVVSASAGMLWDVCRLAYRLRVREKAVGRAPSGRLERLPADDSD